VLQTAEVTGWDQLDPHRAPTPPSFYHFFGSVYSGLVRWETGPDTLGDVRRVVPDLAESWEQPDDRSFLFHLRPGARWHDVPPANGRRVTSADVVFSFQRLRESVHRELWQRVVSVQAVDEDSVLITLTGPYSAFLGQLASGVNVLVLPEAVEASEQGDLHSGPVIGTGPFVFDPLASDRRTDGVFLRNPSFYEEGLPQVDRLERQVAGSEDAAIAMFRAGRSDFLVLSASGAQRLMEAGLGDTQLFHQADLSGWALTFKPQPPFDQAAARQAASLALDRPRLWEVYTGTQAPAALGLGMPAPDAAALLPTEDVQRAYRRDVEEARRLLAGLGNAARSPFTVTVGDFGPSSVQTGAELVRQLRDVGFVADLRAVPQGLYAATAQTPPGVFQVAFGPVSAPDEADLWLTSRYGMGGSRNVGGFDDPELWGLIQAQSAETDPVRRAELLQEAQRLLLERAYQPMVFRDQTWMAVRSRVQGWPSYFDEPHQRALRGVGVSSADEG
jgi:peptide/nickel transport system substrate-binding protein